MTKAKGIHEACALVERLGPCKVSVLYEHSDMEQSAIRTYCARAVDRGMLIRKDGLYQAVAGWREMTGGPAPKAAPIAIAPMEPPYVPQRHVLDSWLVVAS